MSRLVDLASRAGTALSLVAAWVAGIIVVAMTLLILLEIVLRSFLGRSTHVAEEYVGYGMGAMIFLGLGHCLGEGQLIRVDLVHRRLAPAVRRLVEIALCLVALGLAWLLIRPFWINTLRNYDEATISTTMAATPMWIPHAVVLVGMIVFAVQLALYALRLCLHGRVIEVSADNE